MTEPKNLLSLNSFTEDTFDEARSSWRERGEGGKGGMGEGTWNFPCLTLVTK